MSQENQTTKYARCKTRKELNQSTKGVNEAYCSWAEQMLLDKFTKYHRNLTDVSAQFEVISESEKAVKIKVTGVYAYTAGGDDTYECDPWDVWMPKSAMVMC